MELAVSARRCANGHPPSGVPFSTSIRRMSSSYTSVDSSWNCSLVNLVNFSLADALAVGDSVVSRRLKLPSQCATRELQLQTDDPLSPGTLVIRSDPLLTLFQPLSQKIFQCFPVDFGDFLTFPLGLDPSWRFQSPRICLRPLGIAR